MGKKKGKKKAHDIGTNTKLTKLNSPSLDVDLLVNAQNEQMQEIEALQAIFDQEFILHSSTPLYQYIFTIQIPPLGLHFDLGRLYPLEAGPNISIDYIPTQDNNTIPKELSKTELESLVTILESIAQEKIGNAMIYDLVMAASDWIDIRIKPLVTTDSFFDEMIARKEREATEGALQQEAFLQQQQAQREEQTKAMAQLIEDEKNRHMKLLAQRQLYGTDLTQQSLSKRRKSKRRHRGSIDLSVSKIGEDAADNNPLSSSSSSSDSEESMSTFLDDTSPSLQQSRYYCDFKELGVLGRGGGGEVVKVRNRLDRQLYAVKKIQLDPQDPTMKKKILREVKTISRMQHRHIVRYFQAWIEGDVNNSKDDQSDSDESEESEESCQEEEDDQERADTSASASGQGDWNSSDVSSENEGEDEDDWLGTLSGRGGHSSTHFWKSQRRSRRNDDTVSNRQYNNGQNLSFSNPQASSAALQDDGFFWEPLEDDVIGVEPEYRPHDQAKKVRRQRKKEHLYIQMEYCGGNALREVIDKGSLYKSPDKIWTLFRQILEAVVYIHRQGIIHRDIKPPNIFLDAEGTVKLGDFGLAVRPPKRMDDEEDAEDSNVQNMLKQFQITSTASSAAEEYERLRLETLERDTKTLFFTSDISKTSYDINLSDAITTGVGTAFYRAPEQEREGTRYDHKADMFSLGIVLFEMWSPPFTTLMERAHALTMLRDESKLPTTFTAPENVKELIIWLCKPLPTARPTARECLSSPLLPAKMEIEGSYLREALQTLSNPEGRFFPQLMDALTMQTPHIHIEYTYDQMESFRLQSFQNILRLKGGVKDILKSVFERHGAIEHTTPLLMPRAPQVNYTGIPLHTPANSVALVDAAGVSVTLPFDLTERLARFVARNHIRRLKVYQFDRVYRTHGDFQRHPREISESDFDIIWDTGPPGSTTSYGLCLALESLQVVQEVTNSLATKVGHYYLRINDVRITNAILELCNFPTKPSSVRREILKLISKEVATRVHSGPSSVHPPTLKQGHWHFIGKRMKTQGVTKETAEDLKLFFSLCEDGEICLESIEAEVTRLYHKQMDKLTKELEKENVIVEDDISSSVTSDKKKTSNFKKRQVNIQRIFSECMDGVAGLRSLLQALKALELNGPSCVRVDIGYSPQPERYSSGFIFQAVLMGNMDATNGVHHTTNLHPSYVLAEGGRYDSLITRFHLPTVSSTGNSILAAMGVRFSIDRIVESILVGHSAQDVPENICNLSHCNKSGRPLILVCSAGKATDTLLQRLQIALLLWRHGISTEYLHPDPMHLEDLEAYCAQKSLLWMIIVQNHLMLEKQQVKVRRVRAPSEADAVVHSNDIADYMRELIRNVETNWSKNEAIGGYDTTSSTQVGHQTHSLTPLFDITVLDGKYYGSRDKQNKKDRDNEISKVSRRVSKWITTSFGGNKKDTETTKVLSVDLPFNVMRELSSAIMTDTEQNGKSGKYLVASSVDSVILNNPRYRKQLKLATEELLLMVNDYSTSNATKVSNRHISQREQYILLHSLIDDRYDIMSISQGSRPTKANRKFDRK